MAIVESLKPGETDAAAEKSETLALRGESLSKVYGGRAVVDDVNVVVRPGEVVGFLGPNGAGKTTTFYMLVGLLKPDKGRIMFSGEDITTLPLYQRARRGISYLPQEPSVFRKLTVEQNLLAVLETLPLTEEERYARLQTLLDELGISKLAKSKVGVLSGGEIQRVVTYLKERGIGVLMSDHNVHATLSIIDRAYIIHSGKILFEGKPRDIVASDAVRQVFLGERFKLAR